LKSLNVAIVGFGLSGRYLQAPFFENNPNFNLHTIVTKHQDPTIYFPKVVASKNIADVLLDPAIDLISICTPNDTHFEYAKAALMAGKHVLVEKPFTATSEEAETLLALAKEKNKTIAIFQNRRFDSDFLTLQKLIAEGTLGDILHVQINYDRFKPELNPKQWKETIGPASGIIYDLGAHIIDQSIALFGKPKSFEGKIFTERKNSVIDDAFEINLQYEKIEVVLKSSLLVEEQTARYIITGTKGVYTKYGLDVQEDQLKSGMKPNDIGFGVEPILQSGIFINTKTNTSIPTLRGNWAMLFQNLYEAIVFDKALLINPNEVVEQIRIIETIKKMPR
jgi:predicted dehydrogenase